MAREERRNTLSRSPKNLSKTLEVEPLLLSRFTACQEVCRNKTRGLVGDCLLQVILLGWSFDPGLTDAVRALQGALAEDMRGF